MPNSLEISRKNYNFNPDYCSLIDIQRLFDYDESIANAHLAGKPVIIYYRPCLRELPEKHLITNTTNELCLPSFTSTMLLPHL